MKIDNENRKKIIIEKNKNDYVKNYKKTRKI